MASEYKKYLEQIHSKLETPDTILKEIVEEATGAQVTSKRKIIGAKQMRSMILLFQGILTLSLEFLVRTTKNLKGSVGVSKNVRN